MMRAGSIEALRAEVDRLATENNALKTSNDRLMRRVADAESEVETYRKERFFFLSRLFITMNKPLPKGVNDLAQIAQIPFREAVEFACRCAALHPNAWGRR